MSAGHNPNDCASCFFIERVPRNVHPMFCQYERPSVPVSKARGKDGFCGPDGARFLQRRATINNNEEKDQ